MDKPKFKTLLDESRSIVETAIAENRQMTTEEREKAYNLYQEAKGNWDDKELQRQIDELEAKAFAPEPTKQYKDLGAEFVESEAYKGWMKKVAPNGVIPESMKGINSPVMPIDLRLEQKALITGLSDTSAGAFVQPDYYEYQAMGRKPLALRDLISVRQTGSDVIEFVKQTKQVTEAAPVAEATSLSTGLKPEGGMAWEKVSVPVETIAVWVPATKRALSDAKQLRGIINQDLYASLDAKLEEQILTGNGTSPNLKGLNSTVGILTQTYATSVHVTTRKAITNLKTNGLENPTAFLLAPADWEAIDLAVWEHAPYLPSQRTLWGIPVVESHYLTAGTGWLGNWTKAVLWDREQATISISDSHSDFFIRNLVAVLAELRATFAAVKPNAFVKMTLTGAQFVIDCCKGLGLPQPLKEKGML